MIDLMTPAVTRASCYRPYQDITLPHQLRLVFARNQLSVIATCNCGVLILDFRPEREQLPDCQQLYALHVESLL